DFRWETLDDARAHVIHGTVRDKDDPVALLHDIKRRHVVSAVWGFFVKIPGAPFEKKTLILTPPPGGSVTHTRLLGRQPLSMLFKKRGSPPRSRPIRAASRPAGH